MNDLTERNYIHQSPAIVNAKYSLTKIESDIVMLLLTAIDKKDEDFQDYVFSKSDLENRAKTQIKAIELKNQAKSLMSKVLEIKIGDEDWELFTWFSYFGYKKGVITCRFDKALKPYLLNLKQYILADSRYILLMKSDYSRRIYMLLKEYYKFGTRTFNVEELMETLQVPKSYKVYSKFKQGILEPAKNEINKFSDLEVKLIEKKLGRKVVEITYTIKKNKTYSTKISRYITDDGTHRIDTYEDEYEHPNQGKLEF